MAGGRRSDDMIPEMVAAGETGREMRRKRKTGVCGPRYVHIPLGALGDAQGGRIHIQIPDGSKNVRQSKTVY